MVKIKVPKEIRIGAFDFRVVYVPHLVEDYKLLGQSLTDEQVIKIEPDTTDQTKAVTLFHEITHAISNVYGCEMDEHNINRVSQGFTALLGNDFGIELDWSDIE